MNPDACRIYTVGHSTHTMDHLLKLLQMHHIEVLVDVRSSPYSRHASQFNRELLHKSSKDAGMQYLYLGDLLGGYPKDPQFYDEAGYVMYDRLAASAPFLEGIARLENGLQQYKVVVVCSEENPHQCHRSLLIGRVLIQRGVAVAHIRGDGTLEQATDDPKPVEQMTLFAGEDDHSAWKSIRSVSPEKPPRSSSRS